MPIGGKDAFLSKVTFRRESNWYSKTKQELKDMDKMQELAQSLTDKSTKMVKAGKWMVAKEVYDFIVNEQKAIDDANLEKIVSSWKEEEEYWIKRNKKLIGLNSKEESCEGIFISKKALEKWRDHYLKVSKELKNNLSSPRYQWHINAGKADVLIDILKLFEEGKIDMDILRNNGDI